jgi:hypothetical protein
MELKLIFKNTKLYKNKITKYSLIMSHLTFTVLSETQELIKFSVSGFNYAVELPDYCFPQQLKKGMTEFIIPYSKKKQFNLFLETIRNNEEKKELKETDNWRIEYKEKIDEIFDWKRKNMSSIKVACNDCGDSNKPWCPCSRKTLHNSIQFSTLKNFVETGSIR